ncbi:heavy-metal-associated domain-containing protein [Oerskovia sp. NPDC057915]|uniref:heavy-metal-associated domain-containing protein n=1 Tax=Oerskovia sp. NPDC057915 TaxID=3346280 RepID=UPI0036DF2DAB
MRTGARLTLYGLGLVVAFGGAYGVAGAVVPESTVAGWTEGSTMNGHGEEHGAAGAGSAEATDGGLGGLALGVDGFALSSVEAPAVVGEPGELSFQVHDAAGAPVTKYTTTHEKDLHLIVVRSDGGQFRHVHPVLDEGSGTWSIPWEWAAAGSYRVFADFTPTGADESARTLTRTVQVAGDLVPVEQRPTRTAQVDGYTVTVDGELVAGTSSGLTFTVTRDGEPVTVLEPYLGAFGHLVALRDGDLAYLHVHAEGGDPEAGQTAGPTIAFAAEAPTVGRYLLYLDFQVDGQVHTAELVLDAAPGADSSEPTDPDDGSHPEGH